VRLLPTMTLTVDLVYFVVLIMLTLTLVWAFFWCHFMFIRVKVFCDLVLFGELFTNIVGQAHDGITCQSDRCHGVKYRFVGDRVATS
jgi:hypothetical protein